MRQETHSILNSSGKKVLLKITALYFISHTERQGNQRAETSLDEFIRC